MRIFEMENSELSVRSAYFQNGIVRLYMQIMDRSVKTDTDIILFFNLDITFEESCLFCKNVSKLLEEEIERFQIESGGTRLKMSRKNSIKEVEVDITKKDGRNKSTITILDDKSTLHHFMDGLKQAIRNPLEIEETFSGLSGEEIKVCVSDVTVKGDSSSGIISFDSSWFHVSRRVLWVEHQVEMFKNHINDFLEHRKDSLSVYEDFLEINLNKKGCSCQIKGEVSDFRWPKANNIFFQGECDSNQVVHELKKIFC